MTTRTRTDTVVFRHPFRIVGLDDIQAAGEYFVETDEELLETLSFTAYRRVATSIRLPAGSDIAVSHRVVGIEPAELTAALARDIETGASYSSIDGPMPVGDVIPMPGRLPEFRNDQGAADIDIGVKVFFCSGASPPQDHPHVYLDMGSRGSILCPYCATQFRFDPQLSSSQMPH